MVEMQTAARNAEENLETRLAEVVESKLAAKKASANLARFKGETAGTMTIKEVTDLRFLLLESLQRVADASVAQVAERDEKLEVAAKAIADLKEQLAAAQKAREDAEARAAELEQTVTSVRQVSNELQENMLEKEQLVTQLKQTMMTANVTKNRICQCEMAMKNTVLFPCRHLALCDSPFCKAIKVCPTCNTPVESRETVLFTSE